MEELKFEHGPLVANSPEFASLVAMRTHNKKCRFWLIYENKKESRKIQESAVNYAGPAAVYQPGFAYAYKQT